MEDFINYWAAGLSTFLAGLKLWESYRDRRQIHVGYRFIGREDIGTDIILSNTGKDPIMIDRYELFWSKNRFWRKRWYFEHAFPEYDPHSFTIPARDRYTLNFSEVDYLEPISAKRGNLYIRLYHTGRKRPTTLLVAGAPS